jgi:hypothetical protein
MAKLYGGVADGLEIKNTAEREEVLIYVAWTDTYSVYSVDTQGDFLVSGVFGKGQWGQLQERYYKGALLIVLEAREESTYVGPLVQMEATDAEVI